MTAFNQSLTAVLNFGDRTGIVGVGIVGDMIVGATEIIGGALVKRISRSLSASADFSASLLKRTSNLITATLTFVGTLRRITRSLLTGSLSFTGFLGKGRFKVLASTLVFGDQTYNSGIVGYGIVGYMIVGYRASRLEKRIGKPQTATLDFSGDLPKPVPFKGLSAALSFVGIKAPVAVFKGVASTLSFVGVLTRSAEFFRSLSANLLFGVRSGVVGIGIVGLMVVGNGARLTKETRKILAASADFSAHLLRGRLLRATLSFSGGLIRNIAKKIASTLSFVGNITWQTGKTVLTNFFSMF